MGCRVTVGVNDLATTHPDIAAQLVDKSLSTILTAGSHRKVMWRCDKGHEWAAAVKSRTLIGAGCPVCSNRLIIAGINDIATTRPDLAAEMVDKELTHKLGAGSSKKVEWECEHGHRWKATIVSRSKLGNGCPVCSNQKVVAGVNDLATTHPDLAAQLVDQSLATKIVAGTDRKVLWRCERGHEWEASVASRKGGAGCPYCVGNKVIVGETDLATTHPEIAAQAVDQNLVRNLGHGSEQKVEWRCEHGHEWSSVVYSRRDKHECPICSSYASSGVERDFIEAVRCLVGDDVAVIEHDKTLIHPKELDLVIPEARVAFEVNGLYWHSEECGKHRYYHRDKRLACEAAGYQLMSVWEDTWRDKRDIVLGMIAHKLGVADEKRVFARKLEVREISHSVASGFLSANHIQGFAGATMHIGGFFEDELVAVLSVRDAVMSSRMRYSVGEWEIRRYATSCSVVGGFTKLVAFAERHIRELGMSLIRWISLSDCDVSDGHMYEACGFTLDKELPPDYKYWGTVTGNVRKSKEGFQKRRFRERADLVFKDGLSETGLAELNGLHRVYDSGKKRWVKDVLP